MKIINVSGLVLQFDSHESTEEEVQKVIDACNHILSDANINCQPQLIRDNVQFEEITEVDMIDFGTMSEED